VYYSAMDNAGNTAAVKSVHIEVIAPVVIRPPKGYGFGKTYISLPNTSAHYSTFDLSGNYYLTKTSPPYILKFSSSGAPISQWGASGAGPGQFRSISGIQAGLDGNIYVADFMNDKIRKISAYGNVSTIELKHRDADKKYRLKSPCCLAFDDKQNLYVSDLSEHRLKKISNDGYISAVNLKSDGADENIAFSGDISIAVNSNGEMIVTDSKLPQIRKVVFKSQ